MRNATRSGIWVALVLGLVGAVVVGCTQWSNLNPSNPAQEQDTESTSTELAEYAPGTGEAAVESCGLVMLTNQEREAAIQEALNNSKVQSLKKELEERGFKLDPADAIAYNFENEKLVWISAGPQAGIIYATYLGQGYATGAIQEKDKTINLQPDRAARHITGFDPKTRATHFKQIRNNNRTFA